MGATKVLRCHIVLDVGDCAPKLFGHPMPSWHKPLTGQLWPVYYQAFTLSGLLPAAKRLTKNCIEVKRKAPPGYNFAVASWSRGSRGAHDCKSSKGLVAKSHDIVAEESRSHCRMLHMPQVHYGLLVTLEAWKPTNISPLPNPHVVAASELVPPVCTGHSRAVRQDYMNVSSLATSHKYKPGPIKQKNKMYQYFKRWTSQKG